MSLQMDKIGLRARWAMARNRLLGSPGFQRLAMRMPLLRWVARRRAAAQFDLIAGFVYSQILAAFVEAGLIDRLRDSLVSLPEIVDLTGLEADAAERLLKAAQALDLSESPQSGLWTLGQTGAELSANPGALAMVRHHRLLYRDLVDPLALLAAARREETALSSFWTYASKQAGGENSGDYSALMAATQPMVSEQILRAYDFGRHRKMLDIGGGSGAFVEAVQAAAPSLQLGIFDLPEVIAATKTRLGAATRVALHPGSFKADALPKGYDLITLNRILHDHDDAVAMDLLRSIYGALDSGGRLLLIEPMADSKGAKKMGNAYFGVYLWAMNSGRPRSATEITAMLQSAGFSAVRLLSTSMPLIASALIATRT
jgi:demethylspheroidene O-methyltransferase